jgi:hypothetical protein
LTALDEAVDVSGYVRAIDTWRPRPIGVSTLQVWLQATPSGVRLTDGNSTTLTVAKGHLANLMGADASVCKRQLSRPRFFLIEWLAIIPACYQVPRDAEPGAASPRHFKYRPRPSLECPLSNRSEHAKQRPL